MGEFNQTYQGVVDAILHVHGIKKVMIADSSILPIKPSGDIGMLVNVIAEMGADIATLTKDS